LFGFLSPSGGLRQCCPAIREPDALPRKSGLHRINRVTPADAPPAFPMLNAIRVQTRRRGEFVLRPPDQRPRCAYLIPCLDHYPLSHFQYVLKT